MAACRKTVPSHSARRRLRSDILRKPGRCAERWNSGRRRSATRRPPPFKRPLKTRRAFSKIAVGRIPAPQGMGRPFSRGRPERVISAASAVRQRFAKRPDSLNASLSGPAAPPVLMLIGISMTVSPMKALSIGLRSTTPNNGRRRCGTRTSKLRSVGLNCLFASWSAFSRRSASSPHQKPLTIGR
jgi:hypothetical protein